MKVTYRIDVADWSSGHEDRERAEEALGQWFEGLSLKSQLAILYAYQLAEKQEDDMRDEAWEIEQKIGQPQQGQEAQETWDTMQKVRVAAVEREIAGFRDGCPWVEMVREAEKRILNEKAPWVNESGATGFNLFLDPIGVATVEEVMAEINTTTPNERN